MRNNGSPSERLNHEVSSGNTESMLYAVSVDANWVMILFISSGLSDMAKTASHMRFSISRTIAGLWGPSLCETSMTGRRWKDCFTIRNGRSRYIGVMKSARCNGAQRLACPVLPPERLVSNCFNKVEVASVYSCCDISSAKWLRNKDKRCQRYGSESTHI